VDGRRLSVIVEEFEEAELVALDERCV